MYPVSFANLQNNVKFKHKKKIRNFILEIFRLEKVGLSHLQYVFCTDEFLIKMNSLYLKHNTYTDIITFDLSDTNEISAEVYISVERVKENAILFKSSFQTEIQRVIFHGALHLCGYNDKSQKEIKTMRNKEDSYLYLFNAFINNI